jgi:hypothetical protein
METNQQQVSLSLNKHKATDKMQTIDTVGELMAWLGFNAEDYKYEIG